MPGDLYATKGTEYLIVIAYLLLMAGLGTMLALPRFAGDFAAKARRKVARAAPWFDLVEGYHFHQGHAWAADWDGETVTVGLDDFAARLLGPPDGLKLPEAGARIRQGEPGWTVRFGDRVLTMLAPVGGQVVAVNPAVLASPRLATDAPYGEGWLLKVRAPNHQASLRNLFSGELASLWMQYTAERLRGLPAGELGVVMPDGGAPVRGFARALGPEQWELVAREFFLNGGPGDRGTAGPGDRGSRG